MPSSSSFNSDAPALSNFQDPGVAKVTAAVASADIPEDQAQAESNSKTAEHWDDEALAAATYKKGAATGSELLDMKSMDPKRSDQGYIKEKMRVEETKAQLAAAREGMERRAAQLKVDKEKKNEKKQANQASIPSNPRFGAAAASMGAAGGGGGGTGAKWLPPHLRAGGSGVSVPRARMPGSIGGFQGKVDTADEQLFPDLATADAIIEKQDRDSRAPKKTPVGGGATWATKMKKPVVRAPKVEPVSAVASTESEDPAKAETAAPSSAAPVAKAPKRVVKKKKDLSTFKPGSS